MLGVTIDHLLSTYGYWVVFLAITVESLGIPLPGETTLITAALYAGSTHHLNIVLIIVVASAAAIIGDNIGYAIGRVGGYRLLRRYGRYVRIDDAKIKLGRYLFDRHGGVVVFFGRFVSVLRTYAAFLAGTNRMEWHKFLLYNAAGGILWATTYALAAYLAGDVIRRVGTIITIVSLVVAIVLIVLAMVFVRHHIRGLEQLAEEAYPGPLEKA
jgi:membrane protein DedA with SNARE-associated domain